MKKLKVHLAHEYVVMSLKVILGPMFAGKSSTALQMIRSITSLGIVPFSITSCIDTRYDPSAKSICTHSGDSEPAVGVHLLSSVLDLPSYKEALYVIIEEGQFFPDLHDTVLRMVEEHGKHVTVFGLDGDSERKPFGQILDLIPKADSYVKLTALCKMCRDGTVGVFTAKMAQGQGQGNEQVCIGGENLYMAVCRKHFLESHAMR
jgi:thymidine kinase